MSEIEVDGHKIRITNPHKLLYPEAGIRKIDYIAALIDLAPYILPHTKGKALTCIRYPHGVDKTFFYQKRPPKGTPEWVSIITKDGDTFVDLNSLPTLVWLANSAVLEFHTPFESRNDEDELNALVFDLDPSKGQTFENAAECALIVHETLEKLGVECLVKTSGATGLQVYVPTRKINFEEGKRLNAFFGKYFAEKYPNRMTIERLIKNRGTKLYFDYLQMHEGKNIISVYSPRAVSCGAISMPVEWEELEKGINPCDFNLKNAEDRLEEKGDLFDVLLEDGSRNEALDEILYGSVLNG